VKLDQVAEDAGVAKGTIYLYFRSKEDLFCECLLGDTPGWHARAKRIIALKIPAADRLHRLIDLQAEAYRKKGPLIQQMLQMGPTLPLSPDILSRVHAHLQGIIELDSQLFQEGIETGEFSNSFTAAQMAVIFLQIFDLNVKFRLFHVPPLEPQDVFTALMKLFGTR
jgi:TetR/AcrR family fatty acid metabolism transcriptional regulator